MRKRLKKYYPRDFQDTTWTVAIQWNHAKYEVQTTKVRSAARPCATGGVQKMARCVADEKKKQMRMRAVGFSFLLAPCTVLYCSTVVLLYKVFRSACSAWATTGKPPGENFLRH